MTFKLFGLIITIKKDDRKKNNGIEKREIITTEERKEIKKHVEICNQNLDSSDMFARIKAQGKANRAALVASGSVSA